MRMLRRAGWWVRDYAYAALWQARAVVGRASADAFRAGDGVPVVVIPGVYETWRFLQPSITALHARGHPVHVLDPLRDNRMPVAQAAEIVAHDLAHRDLHDVVVLAHSKGGLIGKYVMTHPEAGDRVRGMVAVAAPFGGSRYARLMLTRTLRSFSPRDATILALAKETSVNARIVSIYAAFDPHIPEGSELPGATNVRLETGGHFRILADRRIFAEVEALAARAS